MPSSPFLKSFAEVALVTLARDMRCHFRACMTRHGCFYERVVGSLQEKKSSLLYISQEGDMQNEGTSTWPNWLYTKFEQFLYKLHNSSTPPVCCYGQFVAQQQEKKSNQLYVSQYETQMQNKEASMHP